MTKKYQAKVSYGLLTFVFLVFFGPLIPDFVNGELNGKMIGLILFLSLVFAFIVHLFLKTQYTIENNKLKIKCGIFSFKPIDIDEIKEISKTKSIISSPAPSFDRIEIKYGKFDELIISPKDKFNFAEDLTKINPRIKNKITE
ncbi:MAG: PH domain-containing protein [Lutimonas sp.]